MKLNALKATGGLFHKNDTTKRLTLGKRNTSLDNQDFFNITPSQTNSKEELSNDYTPHYNSQISQKYSMPTNYNKLSKKNY